MPVVVPGVALGAATPGAAIPGATPALPPVELPAFPAAPPAAAPGAPTPAANAQPEDMASAVAITIVVIFMISVSLFMSEDKVCRRPSFQIGSINLSLAATHGQCDAKCAFAGVKQVLPLGADSPQSGFRPALRIP
jgi:hypothetical protein